MGDLVTRVQRTHIRLYRWFVMLTPTSHQQRHGERQVQLFADLITSGHRPWRLWAAAIPDLVSLVSSSMRTMPNLARIALFPLSALNAAAGLLLASLAIGPDSVPLWVAAAAVAIALQGIYTLMWLLGRLPGSAGAGNAIFATGQAVALVVGAAALVAAIVTQSPTHPEYGPPTMLTLVIVHALVGLIAWSPTSTRARVGHPTA